MCKVLEVSTSGYYDWLNRLPSKRSIENKALQEQIETIYEDSSQTYGSPRIHKELIAQETKVSRVRVARIMRANGIQSKIRKKYKVTTDSKHEHNIAPNLLDRQFEVDAPSKVWVSDITYVWTDEGWLYLTVVLDLYDRKVIGWALSLTMEAIETTMAAFAMALLNRKPSEGMLFHSDRGVQYACKDFVEMLTQQGVIQSMSRKGNCWDNAVAESFFKTIKVERIYRKKYKTIQEAKVDIFSYIETWYNTKRRHSSIGYATPLEMEQFFYKKLGA